MSSTILPLKTVSTANRREHWSVRAERTRTERHTAKLLVPYHCPPCIVKLTRISPRPLDDDNLRGALKAVRDGIADRLNINDRDPRVTWEYAQEKGKRGEYAVRVEIR